MKRCSNRRLIIGLRMLFASLAVVLIAAGMLIFLTGGTMAEPCYAEGSGQDKSTETSNDIINMTVSGIHDTVYNGSEQKLQPVITDDQNNVLTEGEDYELSYSNKTEDGTTDVIRNAGLVTVTITGKGSYTGVLPVSYSIEPAPLSVETYSAERAFNGEALTASGQVTGLFPEESLTLVTQGTITDPGSVPNGYEIRWDETAESMNYVIKEEKIGTLKVTAAYEDQNGIIAESYCGTYDGKEHPITAKALLDGSDISYSTDDGASWQSYVQPFKDATDGPVAVKIKAENPDYEHGTAQVTVTVQIRRAALKAVTRSAAGLYTGKALTADGSISGLVNGETAVVKTTGSQTDVGSSLNTYEILWAQDSPQEATALSSNYIVTSENLGTLKVTTNDISNMTVSGIADTVYNDSEQKLSVVVKDDQDNEFTKDKDYELSYSNKTAAGTTDLIRDAGDVTVTITGKGGCTGKLTACYRIEAAPLAVETFSAEKKYDGKALTAEGKLTGLVNGETAILSVTGRQTEVGSSPNTYTLIFAEDDPENATAGKNNYRIAEEHLGTLTVTESAAAYTFTAGENSEWTMGSKADLEFRVARASHNEEALNHFTGIDIDGKQVAADKYTAAGGSVIITLKAGYLDTLSPGRHTLTARFDDGSAEAHFTIVKVADVDNGNSNSGSGDRNHHTVRTGDEEMPGLWIMLMITSVIILAAFVRLRASAAKDKN